jgi:cyclophilin family peptidyl-prolyl cis-trans isomerase/HEAT repeat protein
MNGRDAFTRMLLSPQMRRSSRILPAALCAALFTACAAAPRQPPVVVVAPPPIPVITWEEKIAWMIRLEDQRILRDPNPPPPAVLRPATATSPIVLAAAAPSDLVRLLEDPEARVRRRAALAVGRVGLVEGVEPLGMLLADADPEVRQMAAFALGLIRNAAARPLLSGALRDPDPLTQGRAAEALGIIGDRADATAIADMVRMHIVAGALNGIDADDITYPMAPPVEAVRLGVYAITRLGSFDALWTAVMDPSGQLTSRWWPVAYAFGRVGDARGAPILISLMNTPGRYTAAFAVRGLPGAKAVEAVPAVRQIVAERRAHPAIVIQAVRALGAFGDRDASPALIKILADPNADPSLRVEAMAAIAGLIGEGGADLFIELLTDRSPAIRGAARRALARLDPDLFLATLAGLDADRDWTVRAAEATALGTIPPAQGLPRLTMLLNDSDQRVIPSAVAALAVSRPPGVEKMLMDRLIFDDFVVRAAAANALADVKAVSATDALIEAYNLGLADSTYVARAAALSALARISPPAARPVLQRALVDPEWPVRLRAVALLRDQAVTGLEPSIRPATPAPALDDATLKAVAVPQYSPHAFIETDKGTIEIELAVLDAPLTAHRFATLARKGFFNGLAIHRVVADFVVQDGDPRGDGEGGPGYSLRDELNQRPYLRGTVGMALDWEDTGGSQFFVTHSPQPHLDARYTVFGHVVNGMDVVDRIVQGDVVRTVRIWDGVTATR